MSLSLCPQAQEVNRIEGTSRKIYSVLGHYKRDTL